MNAEPSTLIILGIAVAGLVIGISSFVLLIVNRRDAKDYAMKQELANLKLQLDSIREFMANTNEWKHGVERQLGRIEGMIAAKMEERTEE